MNLLLGGALLESGRVEAWLGLGEEEVITPVAVFVVLLLDIGCSVLKVVGVLIVVL